MSKTTKGEPRKTEILFTRCDEKLRARVARYAAKLAKKRGGPVSLAMATRHALEQELKRSEDEDEQHGR